MSYNLILDPNHWRLVVFEEFSVMFEDCLSSHSKRGLKMKSWTEGQRIKVSHQRRWQWYSKLKSWDRTESGSLAVRMKPLSCVCVCACAPVLRDESKASNWRGTNEKDGWKGSGCCQGRDRGCYNVSFNNALSATFTNDVNIENVHIDWKQGML